MDEKRIEMIQTQIKNESEFIGFLEWDADLIDNNYNEENMHEKIHDVKKKIINELRQLKLSYSLDSEFIEEKHRNMKNDKMIILYHHFKINLFLEESSCLNSSLKFKRINTEIKFSVRIAHKIFDKITTNSWSNWNFFTIREVECCLNQAFSISRYESEINTIIFLKFDDLILCMSEEDYGNYHRFMHDEGDIIYLDLKRFMINEPFEIAENLDFMTTDGASRAFIKILK